MGCFAGWEVKSLVRFFYVVCLLAVFSDGLAYAVIVPFLSTYMMDEFGLTETQSGFVFASYSLAAILASPPSGWLVDKYKWGRITVFIVGFPLIMAGTLVFMTGNSFGVFVLARCLQGFSTSFTWTAVLAMFSVYLPPNELSARFGVSMSFSSAGLLLGPVFGGFLYDWGGYLTPFYAVALLNGLDGVFRLTVIPVMILLERHAKQQQKPPQLPLAPQPESVTASTTTVETELVPHSNGYVSVAQNHTPLSVPAAQPRRLSFGLPPACVARPSFQSPLPASAVDTVSTVHPGDDEPRALLAHTASSATADRVTMVDVDLDLEADSDIDADEGMPTSHTHNNSDMPLDVTSPTVSSSVSAPESGRKELITECHRVPSSTSYGESAIESSSVAPEAGCSNSVWTDARTVAVLLTVVFAGAGLASIDPTLPIYLEDRFGMSPSLVGVVFMMSSLGFAIGSPTAAHLAQPPEPRPLGSRRRCCGCRPGGWNVILFSLGGIGIGFPLLALMPVDWLEFLVAILFGFFVGGSIAPSVQELTQLLTENCLIRKQEEPPFGVLYGVFNACYLLGMFVGPLIVTPIVQKLSFLSAMLCMGGAFLAVVPLLFFLHQWGSARRIRNL